ncbi:MAG: hypothetical protein P8P30_09685 [Rickettsiales bacterium]|nr:hypothetical protein [Rickettsiales bacterium]
MIVVTEWTWEDGKLTVKGNGITGHTAKLHINGQPVDITTVDDEGAFIFQASGLSSAKRFSVEHASSGKKVCSAILPLYISKDDFER